MTTQQVWPATGVSPTTPSTDVLAPLLERTAAGDRDAFAELYDALAARVLGVALRVLANRALAEETTQEVFLHIWQNASAFDGRRGNARSWVMTLAHHRAVDHVRLHANAASRDRRVGLRDIQLDRDVVADHIHDHADARAVRAALAELTDAHRDVLMLAYYGGLTQTEIAAQTDTPLGTVKTRTRDALSRLRRILPSPA